MNTVTAPDTSEDIRLNVHSLQELPAISPMASMLLQVIGNEDTTIPQLAGIIKQDASLGARVIGLANSAYFAQREPITSVEDAIFKALGLRLTCNLALGIALSGSFGKTVSCRAFDSGNFWKKAVLTANLTRDLCACVKAEIAPEQDSAYLAGLLHEFGLLPLVYLFPEKMTEFFHIRERDALHLQEVLRRELGTDHHEVGAWLANKWQIPDAIIEVIAHHAEEGYAGRHATLVKLVHFASAWATQYLQDGLWENLPEDAPALLAELESELGLDRKRVLEILQRQHAGFSRLESLSHVLAGN